MRYPNLARVVGAVLLALCHAGPAAADEVTFRIHDRVPAVELEEVTTIYVDGRLAGTFRLDDQDRETTLTVTVPAAESHDYALCGHVVVRDADGQARRHAFDVSGTLFDVADRDFEAIASDGFTRFFLTDVTAGRPPARIEATQTHACAAAVS